MYNTTFCRVVQTCGAVVAVLISTVVDASDSEDLAFHESRIKSKIRRLQSQLAQNRVAVSTQRKREDAADADAAALQIHLIESRRRLEVTSADLARAKIQYDIALIPVNKARAVNDKVQRAVAQYEQEQRTAFRKSSAFSSFRRAIFKAAEDVAGARRSLKANALKDADYKVLLAQRNALSRRISTQRAARKPDNKVIVRHALALVRIDTKLNDLKSQLAVTDTGLRDALNEQHRSKKAFDDLKKDFETDLATDPVFIKLKSAHVTAQSALESARRKAEPARITYSVAADRQCKAESELSSLCAKHAVAISRRQVARQAIASLDYERIELDRRIDQLHEQLDRLARPAAH